MTLPRERIGRVPVGAVTPFPSLPPPSPAAASSSDLFPLSSSMTKRHDLRSRADERSGEATRYFADARPLNPGIRSTIGLRITR